MQPMILAPIATGRLIALMGIVLIIPLAWPLIGPSAGELRGFLQEIWKLVRLHPTEGYVIFTASFFAVVVLGVPIVTLCMLLAGILFDFWTGVGLVMLGRLGGAALCFQLSKTFLVEGAQKPEHWWRRNMSNKLEYKVTRDSYLYLLMLRL